VPNVRGLLAAPDLLSLFTQENAPRPYGPHAFVSRQGSTLTLTNAQNRVVASVDLSVAKPKVKANLAQVDGDCVTAVNAFLRPYGKVKAYWRTGEYRWHPLSGAPTPPVKTPSVTNLAPQSVVSPRPAPVKAETVRITVGGEGAKGVTVDEVVPDPEPETDTDDEATPSMVVATVHPATNGDPIETVKRWQDRGTKKQPIAKNITKTYSMVDDVIVPSRDLRRLDAMHKRRVAGQPSFGIITGPAGTAKTRLAQAWAFVNDLPVVIVEGQSIQTAGDWFGGIIPTDHGFDWVWSDAAKLLMTGQPCLVVIDELNRPENERALNGIMGLTDWKGTVKPIGAPSAITLQPGQCLVATLNEGPEFVGTVEVDAAVRNRFSTGIRMDYTTEPVEVRILLQQAPGIDKEVAKRLVRVAHAQRAKRDDDLLYPSHNVISTRGLVDIAQNITVGGLDPKEALWANLDSAFWPEDKPALTVLIESQFGPDAAPMGDDDLASDDDLEHMLGDI
jgi:hypothetical protein